MDAAELLAGKVEFFQGHELSNRVEYLCSCKRRCEQLVHKVYFAEVSPYRIYLLESSVRDFCANS